MARLYFFVSNTLRYDTRLIAALTLVGIAVWVYIPHLWALALRDTSVGFMDMGVWHLVWLGLLLWLLAQLLSGLIFGEILRGYKLPSLGYMVSQFNLLTLWQQYVLYMALFALLFLGAILSIAAIF